MWYLLSEGRLGQDVPFHTTATQARALFSAYALGFIAICGEIMLLNLRAWQLRDPLHLDAQEQRMTRAAITGWSIPMSTGLLSLILALTLPISRIDWAGWIYFLLPILVLLNNRRCRAN